MREARRGSNESKRERETERRGERIKHDPPRQCERICIHAFLNKKTALQ